MRRKTAFYLCLPILIISVIFSACSLSRDESSGPSYDEMQEKIEKYNTELNEFRKKNDSADSSRIIETETPEGNYCTITNWVYDGGRFNMYELVTMRSEGAQTDNYYVIDDSLIYITREYSEGGSDLIEKYAVIDGNLFIIDEEEKTLTAVEKSDSTDLYLSIKDMKDLFKE
ncbi:MAG: hypothetical protein IKN14_04910 [Clostridiales bacterium]|nr:hypothetical protein [Clostridiales bacterium]